MQLSSHCATGYFRIFVCTDANVTVIFLRYWLSQYFPIYRRKCSRRVIVLLAILEFPYTPMLMQPSSNCATDYLRISVYTDANEAVKFLRYNLSQNFPIYQRKCSRKVIALKPILEFPYIPTQMQQFCHCVTSYLRISVHTDTKVAVKSFRYWLSQVFPIYRLKCSCLVIVLLAISEFPHTRTQMQPLSYWLSQYFPTHRHMQPSSHCATGYLRISVYSDTNVAVKSLRYWLSERFPIY